MKPELASPEFAGFPMTSLLSGTPLAAIWKSALWGQVLEELVRRPEQVVYSEVPSGLKVGINKDRSTVAYDYKTIE